MSLFTLFKKSIYNPVFYRQLLEERFSFTLKYFISLLLVLSVIASIPLTAIFLPILQRVFHNVTPAFVKAVPDDLVITLHQGKLSVNKSEPVIVALPKLEGNTTTSVISSAALVVIDTNASPTPEMFSLYDTKVLVTKDTLTVKENDQIKLQSLSDLPDQSFDKARLTSFADKASTFARWLSPFVVFMSFLLALIVLSSLFLYMVPGALLVWLIARRYGHEIGYRKAYQLSLHAVSLGALVYMISIVLFGAFLNNVTLPIVALIMGIVAWKNLSRLPAPLLPQEQGISSD